MKNWPEIELKRKLPKQTRKLRKQISKRLRRHKRQLKRQKKSLSNYRRQYQSRLEAPRGNPKVNALTPTERRTVLTALWFQICIVSSLGATMRRELTGNGCSESAFVGFMGIVLIMKTQVLIVVYVLYAKTVLR